MSYGKRNNNDSSRSSAESPQQNTPHKPQNAHVMNVIFQQTFLYLWFFVNFSPTLELARAVLKNNKYYNINNRLGYAQRQVRREYC